MSDTPGIELQRCLLSLTGSLESIAVHMPECAEGGLLMGIVEEGMGSIFAYAEQLAGEKLDEERARKSRHRGFQTAVLLAGDLRGKRSEREQWKQDPDEFMREWRAEFEKRSTDAR